MSDYTWEVRFDKEGKAWEVNFENINQLCYAYARAKGLRELTTVEKSTESVNLLWSLNTATVNVNWKVLKSTVGSEAYLTVVEIQKKLLANGNDAIERLKRLRQQTRSDTVNYEASVKVANEINQGAIKKFDNLAKDFATIRNTGATFVCTGAGVVGGVAGAVALGAGATLKGIGKYQDTGSIAEATVETFGEILVYCTGIKAAKATGKVAQFFYGVFTNVAVEGCKSYASGNSLPEAATAMIIEGLPLDKIGGESMKKLKEHIGKSSHAAVINATGGTLISVGKDKTKDGGKAAVKYLTSKRPNASKNLKFLDDGYINLKTGPAGDDQYVKTFCIRPATQR